MGFDPVSILIFLLVCLLIVIIAERFSPDPMLTWVVRAIVFVVVIIKLLGLIH